MDPEKKRFKETFSVLLTLVLLISIFSQQNAAYSVSAETDKTIYVDGETVNLRVLVNASGGFYGGEGTKSENVTINILLPNASTESFHLNFSDYLGGIPPGGQGFGYDYYWWGYGYGYGYGEAHWGQLEFNGTYLPPQTGNYSATVYVNGDYYTNISFEVYPDNDLAINSFTAYPDPAFEGDLLTFPTTVENKGAHYQSGYLKFYVDGSETSSVFIGLVPGQVFSRNFHAVAKGGPHQFNATIEANGFDKNLSNNARNKTLFADYRDILVQDFSMTPLNPLENETVYFNATVFNNGSLPENSSLVFYANGSEIDREFVSLAPGENHTKTFSKKFAKGNHLVEAALDHLERERNYTNNHKTIEFSVGFRENKLTGLLFSPQKPLEGETLSINASAENTGNATTITLLRLLVDGEQKASQTVTILPSGNITAGFLLGLARGAHILNATLDPVAGENEDDNSLSTTVFVDHRSIFVYDANASPARVYPQQPSTLSARVKNTGSLTETVTLRLIADGSELSNTTMVLSPSESRQKNYTRLFSVPGNKSINFTVDALYLETNDYPNHDSTYLMVDKRDTIVSDLSFNSTSPWSGQKVKISSKVTNNGTRPENVSVQLLVNSMTQATQTVSFGALETKTVTFTKTFTQGQLTIGVRSVQKNYEQNTSNNRVEKNLTVEKRDVLVTSVYSTTTYPKESQPTSFNVSLLNRGTRSETLTFHLYVDGEEKSVSQQQLAPNGGKTLAFSEKLSGGTHHIIGFVEDMPYEEDGNNNGYTETLSVDASPLLGNFTYTGTYQGQEFEIFIDSVDDKYVSLLWFNITSPLLVSQTINASQQGKRFSAKFTPNTWGTYTIGAFSSDDHNVANQTNTLYVKSFPFALTPLNIQEKTLTQGEKETFYYNVRNNGENPEKVNVSFRVNDVEQYRKEVLIAPSQYQTVSFQYTFSSVGERIVKTRAYSNQHTGYAENTRKRTIIPAPPEEEETSGGSWGGGSAPYRPPAQTPGSQQVYTISDAMSKHEFKVNETIVLRAKFSGQPVSSVWAKIFKLDYYETKNMECSSGSCSATTSFSQPGYYYVNYYLSTPTGAAHNSPTVPLNILGVNETINQTIPVNETNETNVSTPTIVGVSVSKENPTVNESFSAEAVVEGNPELVWLRYSGVRKNMTLSSPNVYSVSISFTATGQKELVFRAIGSSGQTVSKTKTVSVTETSTTTQEEGEIKLDVDVDSGEVDGYVVARVRVKFGDFEEAESLGVEDFVFTIRSQSFELEGFGCGKDECEFFATLGKDFEEGGEWLLGVYLPNQYASDTGTFKISGLKARNDLELDTDIDDGVLEITLSYESDVPDLAEIVVFVKEGDTVLGRYTYALAQGDSTFQKIDLSFLPPGEHDILIEAKGNSRSFGELSEQRKEDFEIEKESQDFFEEEPPETQEEQKEPANATSAISGQLVGAELGSGSIMLIPVFVFILVLFAKFIA